MPKCSSIEPFVTAYVDGEMATADRQAVDEHVRLCAPCRTRIMAEQAVRDLCRERKSALSTTSVPEALRAACARHADARMADLGDPSRGARLQGPLRRPVSWRSHLAPFALAATLVLVVAGAFLYQLTSHSSRAMAAELTADHVKCFALNAILSTHQTPELVQSSMASSFGWQAQLPKDTDRGELELIGSRPCLYGEGRVAHIMYRHNGRPVSLFMLPKSARSDELLQVLGHEAAIWSVGDRTFVLIAREARADVERLATFVRASLR